MITRLFLTTVFCLSFFSVVEADVIFNIDDTATGEVPLTGEATVDVVFTLEATDSHSLFAFNVEPDLQPAGADLPTGVTFDSVVDLSSNFAFTTATPGGENDIGIFGESPNLPGLVLSAGDTETLFALRFRVDETAAAGFYSVVLDDVPNSNFFTAIDGDTALPINVGTTNGGFTLISAVPEPGSAAVILFTVSAAMMFRRRRC